MVGPPMVMRLFGVRPVRPASAERGTFSLSTARFWTEAARLVRRGVVAWRIDREGLERQTGSGKRRARRASPRERGTRARRDAPRNVRPGMRGIAEWISRVAKTYRRAGAGSPATLASHGLGPRVSHRGLLRSCVYRGGSVRRAREMPPGDAAPPATTGETPLFLVSCFETPAFRAIRRISENRGAPRAFFTSHHGQVFSLVLTMNEHLSTGLPVGPPRP